MEQTAKAFEDPRTAGMMTAKAEQMLKEGGASLDRMQDDMARAMQQMQQDPRVMNEMAKVRRICGADRVVKVANTANTARSSSWRTRRRSRRSWTTRRLRLI